MKKAIAFSMAVFICAGLCIPGTAAAPTYPDAPVYGDEKAQKTLIEENPLESDLLDAINTFSYACSPEILYGQAGNTIYSPTALYMSLSLAATGARGDTRQELLEVLGMKNKTISYLSKQNGNLFRRLYTNNGIGVFRLASSFWLHDNAIFRSDFNDTAAPQFYTETMNVDFARLSVARQISEWIVKNSSGNVIPPVKIAASQQLSIINVPYFEDEWLYAFDPADTEAGPFALANGNTAIGSFMKGTLASAEVYRAEGNFTRLRVPLKSGGSMLLILPDEGVGVNQLLTSPETTTALFAPGGENQQVALSLPKFSFSADLTFNNALKSMGILTPFSEQADFSAMVSGGKTMLTDVRQQAAISIGEYGIGTSSNTEVKTNIRKAGKTTELTFDRPFLFAITSDSSIDREIPLLIGVVNKPSVT